MTLGVITYNTAITQVKDWIKANCINISNYGALPSCFKSGYSVTGKCTHSSCPSDAKGVYDQYTISISGNAINQVDPSIVDTQMTEFWNTCGGLSINSNIVPENCLAFMQDMISFCSARIGFAISQYSSTKYLVYVSGTVNYLDYKVLSSNQLRYKFVTATDVANDGKGILYTVVRAVNTNARLIPIRYSENIF